MAAQVGGRVRTIWHVDSEPVPVPRIGGRFLHLTQGFEVTRDSGEPVCLLVDDITIVDGLDPAAPAPPGWHRLLTDDQRLLRLLARTSDPGGPLDTALDEAAALWGEPSRRTGNVWRLESDGATIALAAPAGGERERPCEIVTPPLLADHQMALDDLLGPARALGFTVPAEGATHIHFDGAPFRTAPALANLVRLFGLWRAPLHDLLGTNPHCRRLSQLPAPLLDVVAGEPDLAAIKEAADRGGLTKFFDVNLTQLLTETPLRDTVEIRILPGTLNAAEATYHGVILERLLDRCLRTEPIPAPPADPRAAVRALQEMAQSWRSERRSKQREAQTGGGRRQPGHKARADVDRRLGERPGLGQGQGFPDVRRPGGIAADQTDPEHRGGVGGETVVQRKPGDQAEHERSGDVHDERPPREGLVVLVLDHLVDQIASAGTKTGGHPDEQSEDHVARPSSSLCRSGSK